MKLTLTTAQAAQIEPHLRTGWTLLGRITREGFDGTNGATSGRLEILFAEIPSERLDAVRHAIAGEPERAGTKPRRSKNAA